MYAVPVFFMGLLFQIVFLCAGVVTALGRMNTLLLTQFQPRTNFYIIDAILAQNWPALRSALSHLVLPR